MLIKRRVFEEHMKISTSIMNYHFYTQVFADYRLRIYYSSKILSNTASGEYKNLISNANEITLRPIDFANFLRIYFNKYKLLLLELENFLINVSYNKKGYKELLYSFYLKNKINIETQIPEDYLASKLLELEIEHAFRTGISNYLFEVDSQTSCINLIAMLFKSKKIARRSGLISQPKNDFYTYVLNNIALYFTLKDFNNTSANFYEILSRKLIKKTVVAFLNSQSSYGRFKL